MKNIPLFRTHISARAIERVEQVLLNGWLGAGKHVEKFENDFKEKYNAPAAVMLTSCTAALHLSCKLVEKRSPGKWWIITTPMTFIATNHAIRMVGLQPNFADIDPTTGNISPESIKELVDKNRSIIAGIMVVHYAGLPADMDAIYEIAGDIPVIQDAAHAMGAKYKDKWIGSFGDYICYSMNAKKNCPSGDGGMLVVRKQDEELVRRWRWFGITKETYERDEDHYKWQYDVPFMGYKYDPTDIVAAIARSEFEQLEHYNDIRRKYMEIYREELTNVPGITLLANPDDRTTGAHMMVVLAENRGGLGRKLNENNIDFGVHYTPSNCFNCFGRGYGEAFCKKTTPNAWEFYKKCITLPLHLYLNESTVHWICSKIKEGW